MSVPAEEAIRQRYPDAIEDFRDAAGMPLLTVSGDSILTVCRQAKEELGFDFFDCLSGVDQKDRFEVVYHLWSTTRNESLLLKVILDHDEPVVDSATPVWVGADWHEREAYDLYGILFAGHPDLRRILLPDDFEGYPMRKDYLETD
ncbi:MAG TPA: NADH-quinone oxidoreductase subunit C [Armatimonadota bacterium]|jgi:NADH-quinone oxidoreductase subunit C